MLGNCYFLATLSSVAEFPFRIKAMFDTQDINDAGIYKVRFYINGQDTPVIIDDYLPVKEDGKLAFASCKDGELWVALLEKAWAKLHGTYVRTEGGLPSFAAFHTMGVPSESYNHEEIKSRDKFFEMLVQNDRRNFTMMSVCRGEGAE